MNEHTIGSLFSGIAGIELGLHRALNAKTIWFIENDKYCQNILKQHYPAATIYPDVTTTNWHAIPKPDILTGGFPCQDISNAGKQAGIKEDTRSGLWTHYAEAIRILRPKIALIENVSALAIRGLNIVLASLAKAGYDAEWTDLRASDFGAPHRRERLFIIAYPSRSRLGGRIQSGPLPAGLGWLEDEGQIILHDPANADSQRSSNGQNMDSKNEFFQDQDRNSPQATGGWAKQECGNDENTPIFITHDWRQRVQRFKFEKIQRGEGFSWCQNVRRIEDFFTRSDIPKPLFCGSRDGVPNWVDRVKACGNAVVPDCAEFLGKRIKEILERGSDE